MFPANTVRNSIDLFLKEKKEPNAIVNFDRDFFFH